jgi:hypothetical protein
VTDQVITVTGNGRRSATYPDAKLLLGCGNPINATSSDESRMHGKEKVYGSIP